MKRIRFITLFVIILLCGTNSYAQGVKIYKSNGVTFNIPYTQLDSIVTVPAKEFVDLGLSVKWAACNVGADKPEEYGCYYSWGEIYPKTEYSADNSFTDKKEIGDISGNSAYDAARANWGAPARIPTDEEIGELCEKCTWERMSYKDVDGMLVTGPNGNCIFLPAAGFYIESSLFGEGDNGYYWSSTPFDSSEGNARYLDFDKTFYYWGNWMRRYLGQTIRPVSD